MEWEDGRFQGWPPQGKAGVDEAGDMVRGMGRCVNYGGEAKDYMELMVASGVSVLVAT